MGNQVAPCECSLLIRPARNRPGSISILVGETAARTHADIGLIASASRDQARLLVRRLSNQAATSDPSLVTAALVSLGRASLCPTLSNGAMVVMTRSALPRKSLLALAVSPVLRSGATVAMMRRASSRKYLASAPGVPLLSNGAMVAMTWRTFARPSFPRSRVASWPETIQVASNGLEGSTGYVPPELRTSLRYEAGREWLRTGLRFCLIYSITAD